MSVNSDRAKEIDAYIDANDCKLSVPQKLELKGKLQELAVYQLPTTLLDYSVKNGRFAAEYGELKTKLGHDLDPKAKGDADKIKTMLLQDRQATKILKDDLKKVGQQRNPGVITWDGSLVNGNRRKAIFEELVDETGSQKWKYLEVSRLPKGTDTKDIWRIEAGLQFSREERLDYGPTNRLLKFKEGRGQGLTEKEIAATMYGGFSEENIKEDLERLKLIDNFLLFIGKPEPYTTIDEHGWHEHFIDLRKFIVKEQKKKTSPSELDKVLRIAFTWIQNNIPHLDLRDLNEIMKVPASKEYLLGQIEKNKVIHDMVYPKPPKLTRGKKTVALEQKEAKSGVPVGQDAPTMQVFDEAVEIVKATEKKGKPGVLLTRALTNLNGIELNMVKGGDKNLKKLIGEIETAVIKIKKKLKSG